MKLLIVIDMQNDFIDGSLGTKEAVAIVLKLQRKLVIQLLLLMTLATTGLSLSNLKKSLTMKYTKKHPHWFLMAKDLE